MKISELGYDRAFLQLFDGNDFQLYDHQLMAIEQLRKGKNVIVSVPTAAGKTLIAYSAIYETFQRNLKSIYIVPLRSLAMEKYSELSRLRDLGLKVKMSIGDYDDTPDFIRRYDAVILTSEKADSLMHHDPSMLNDVGLMVIDEIHTIGDESRGPTLETVASVARYVNPDMRMLALSATVSNAAEMAKWLNASLIRSDFRPVPLKTGIIYRDQLYLDGKRRSGVSVNQIIKETVEDQGQVLMFVSSRKKAEDNARDLAQIFDPSLNIKIASDDSSVYDDMLNEILPRGVAFHHAGLSNDQRTFIEKEFRSRRIKVIVATPTLAAGVNLPARLVIVRDITRWGYDGISYLTNMEIKQMIGRAGRPGYDSFGVGLIYVSSPSSYEAAKEYLSTDPEPVISYLGNDAKVRFNALATISMGLARSPEDIMKFYETTFYFSQNGKNMLEEKINASLKFLESNGFIKRTPELKTTQLGKITSDLYIDPESALRLVDFFSGPSDIEHALYHISICREMIPFNIKDDFSAMEFLDDIGMIDGDIDAAKTAIVLRDWINEASYRLLYDRYGIAPGDVQARISMADWLSYSLAKLSSIYKPEVRRMLEILNLRLKEGIREDILDLVLIPGVGRVRARRLYDAGLRSIADVASATPERIRSIYGFSDTLANSVIRRARSIASKEVR
ncbi:ski2-like helicase [Thermoplasma sp. Kam2015]|uniref:ATP-dependent DNA helicase n=1 Tax=Thermoplasma sp. Kam2015 TaxID=2094122 RepID=UPI000D9B27DC|nr:ATP-dependent DNA helicase [Thermoplasma sp. Kam2015]PYB68250.1 ski2-like helicase [Thermoplasma sp. Kam2015]